MSLLGDGRNEILPTGLERANITNHNHGSQETFSALNIMPSGNKPLTRLVRIRIRIINLAQIHNHIWAKKMGLGWSAI